MNGLALAAILVLGFGPLDWEFPWWLWTLAIFDAWAPSAAEEIARQRRER